MHRRAFLALATGAAVAGTAEWGAADPAEGAAADVFPIIDTHQHIWDLGKFRLPWLERQPELRRSYLMADYLAATKDLGTFPAADGDKPAAGRIAKTIYMEVDLDPAQQRDEAEYVIGLCGRADN